MQTVDLGTALKFSLQIIQQLGLSQYFIWVIFFYIGTSFFRMAMGLLIDYFTYTFSDNDYVENIEIDEGSDLDEDDNDHLPEIINDRTRCNYCGSPNLSTSLHCIKCGAPL